MSNDPQSNLPPGFRFHPTDEELILHYLRKKVTSKPFPISIIADVDIYKFDPWQLPDKAVFGEKEWYFFSPRDRKYPNGARPNRAAASGYWKATGTDKIIAASSMEAVAAAGGSENIGVKKALVFYKGRPPKGVKTNWIMHEYRLSESPYLNHNTKPVKAKETSMRLDNWVLCRIYKKSHALPPASTATASDQDQEEEEQFTQETLLPSLKGPQTHSTLKPQKSTSFSNLLDAMDYSILSSFLSENHSNPTGYESNPFNYESLEQPFNNYISNSNNNSSSSGSSYLFQKVPQLSSYSVPNMENRFKRMNSNTDEDIMHPSKKLINSCSFTTAAAVTTNNNHQPDIPQYNFLNQPFLNQHLLLGQYLQFQDK